MHRCVLFLLALTTPVAAFAPSQHHVVRVSAGSIGKAGIGLTPRMADENSEEPEKQPTSDRYDVSKLVGGEDGEGFNQFDPVLSATGFLSRRFGIIGGLVVFGVLALVEGKEIVKGFGDATPDQGSGETITKASGLKVTEILVGKAGSAPLPGSIVGLRTVLRHSHRLRS